MRCVIYRNVARAHLDPIFVAPVQHILRIGMLQDETLAPVRDDLFHPTSYVFRSLAFVFGNELDATGNFFEARPKVPLAELRGLVQKRHPIEIEQVEDLDYQDPTISVESSARAGETRTARPWTVLFLRLVCRLESVRL